jgi:TrmH family RNA methyltransferase
MLQRSDPVPRVLGRQHPTIRRLRVLRRDPARRQAESVLLAEGIHLAQEALAVSEASIELVVVSPRLSRTKEGRELLATVQQSAVRCFETTHTVIQSLQDARSAQPILTVVRRPQWPPDAGLELRQRNALIGVAHGIQDPGNLGGLFRTLHAAGGTACFVGDGCADPFHPRAVRASMGSILRLPVRIEPTADLLPRLRERGIARIGAESSSEMEYQCCDLTRAVAVFFGGEGSGLPPELLAELEETIRVPLHAGVESLSVGAAAAVVLFEAARQRRAAG